MLTFFRNQKITQTIVTRAYIALNKCFRNIVIEIFKTFKKAMCLQATKALFDNLCRKVAKMKQK